jgi:hypothetical protein
MVKQPVFFAVFLLCALLISCSNDLQIQEQSSCIYDDPTISYISKDGSNCSSIRIQCGEGLELFNTECGCGCRAIQGSNTAPPIGNVQEEQVPTDLKSTLCTADQKDAKACTKEYMPVCGWLVQVNRTCENPFCTKEFANKCLACQDKDVVSYTEGECQA